MVKSLAIVSLFAAMAAANAQSAAPDPQTAAPSQPAAPIVRSYAGIYPSERPMPLRPGRAQDQVIESQPVVGVWLRSEASTDVKTMAATPQRAEFQLIRGRLNVNVHHPADHSAILVDLPGGQVSLFKDGLYTFNADTNTVRVLRGEAAAYPGPVNPDAKPIKVKEDHQLSLVAAAGVRPGEIKSVEAYPYEMTADLLRPSNEARGYEDYGEGYAPYPYPYYAGLGGYPYGYYGYGYPYGFGYGIGFGYYGGFRGGYGFRGGFRR